MLGQTLAKTLAPFRDGCPPEIRAETVRSVLNVVGTSVAASRSDAVDVIVDMALDHNGRGSSPVPGRGETLDVLHSALATGTAAHLDDFDDTHLETVVHPTAAVFAAALARVGTQDVSGAQFLDAVALGMEIQLRLAQAMTPWHYDQGWHITGTVGAVGAAITTSTLMGLDEAATAVALCIASSMSLGHREGFGTMVKPLHPGKAAANGLVAAALARRGGTAAANAFEASDGYFATLSPQVEVERVVEGLGERWVILDNTYKPYPCGIVSQPAIEAAERLHPRVTGHEIAAVEVHCHPLVVELTGNPAPSDGLGARFSTIHGVAVALIDGRVGLEQYDDARVASADVTDLRRRVSLVADPRVSRDAASIEVFLDSGERVRADIDHVRGSLARPLTDAQLDEKVGALVARTLPHSGAQIIDVTRSLPVLPGLRPFAAAIVAH